jgi:ABC-type amino acid transport system permease subunit
VILPQAVRRVLPPLGNDFISCLKDSSLATVLAVPELTQLGRVQRSSTFRVFEVFNSVAMLYLSMTLMLSYLVKRLERRMSGERRTDTLR